MSTAFVSKTIRFYEAMLTIISQAPLQLWKLEVTKDRDNSTTSRLSLRWVLYPPCVFKNLSKSVSYSRTYLPRTPVQFTGVGYFGGKNNELVLSFTKRWFQSFHTDTNNLSFAFSDGDIYMWDQESGILLHVIRGHGQGVDITCVAWNRVAEDPYMFAGGSHDGTVRVWTRVLSEEPDQMSEDATHTKGFKGFFPGFTRSASPYEMDPGSSTSLHSLEDPRSFLIGEA